MSNPRIEPLVPPYANDVQKSFDVVMPAGTTPLNIFRTVGKNPRVLSRMVRGALLDKGSVSIPERELVILRACARCDAEYEWGVHVAAFSGAAGFSQEQIEATYSQTVSAQLWSKKQIALIDMVDELHESSTLSDDIWKTLIQFYSEEQLIELIMLAGLYHAVSFMVNSLSVTAEGFAPRFPTEADT